LTSAPRRRRRRRRRARTLLLYKMQSVLEILEHLKVTIYQYLFYIVPSNNNNNSNKLINSVPVYIPLIYL